MIDIGRAYTKSIKRNSDQIGINDAKKSFNDTSNIH